MSMSSPSVTLDQALQGCPATFRAKLVNAYLELKKNHLESRYEAAGLSAGKFCEISLRLLQHEVLGSHIAFGKKIPNFADECRKIITATSGANESLKIVLPRALVLMYTMRNKRGIGHVGGDVEANLIDSATLARIADWPICELIRIYHSLSLEEAQDLVDSISVRNVSLIWEIGGKKRVFRIDLTARQQTLVLLTPEPSSSVLAEDLCDWVEYASLVDYKRRVLNPLHSERLIEFDQEINTVALSPTGAREAEALVLHNKL